MIFLSLSHALFAMADLDQMNGTRLFTFNITCQTNTSEDCQSETLETISSKIENNSDVQIDIEVLQLQLTNTVWFHELNSLVINGKPSLTTITCESGSNTGAGIVLNDIHRTVTLRNLNFTSCVSRINHNSKNYRSALTLIQCRGMEFHKIVIARSRGLGLLILSHLGGQVHLKSAIFYDNKLPENYTKESVMGGGGVYVQPSKVQGGPYSFYFDNCTFESNTAHTEHYTYLYTNVIGEIEKGYGQGGGVHLMIESGLSNVHVSFSECRFIANKAFIGGGLSVETYGETNNVTVEIKNSLFKKNGCSDKNITQHTYFGGGVYLSFSTLLGESVTIDTHYLIRNVSFIGNCAQFGGGVNYLSDRDLRNSLDSSMLFDNCTFRGNRALFGSAVQIPPNRFLKLTLGYVINPTFRNCYFLKNRVSSKLSVSHNGMQRTPSIGTIYASMHDINFEGHNNFEYNTGTALYIVDGIVNFQNSSANFIKNKGIYGGAVSLIGSSTMIIGAHNYWFINNTATYRGGAIYVLLTDITDFAISRSCFIQYSDEDGITTSSKWYANITFRGNRAFTGISGHTIYASSLRPCQVVNNGTQQKPNYRVVNIKEVFKIRGFKFDNLYRPQIATDGAILESRKPLPLKLIPGHKYEHGVLVFDDLHNEVSTSFKVGVSRNGKNVRLDPAFALFVRDKIQLNGQPNHSAMVSLNLVPPRESYITLKALLVECPPGFKLNNTGSNSECVCNVDAYIGLFKCDSNNFYSHLLPGYWAGRIQIPNSDTPILVTSPCPFCGFRNNNTKLGIALPQNYSILNQVICGKKRKGDICGRCLDKYTVHFHSPNFLCKRVKPVGCRLGWIFYLLSELVPVTFVFISVLAFNISFTSGAINGFILFSQLLGSLDIDASGIITLPDSIKRSISTWTQVQQVLYGFFNLNFFNLDKLSFCLWKGASALDMLTVKYFTVLYSLVLIVAVIWFINRWGGRCCGKCCRITTIRTSVVHGISTFLVLCYAQCVDVSLNLLNPVHFHTEASVTVKPDARVWLNGEIVYFSKEHLVYALPAIFFLLTVGSLPPILLLAYPLANRLLNLFGFEDCKVIRIISRRLSISSLKPLLDTFQGCFKDNLRFFAGLYFLYRWVILLVYMTARSYGAYYTYVGAALVFILTLHTVCQPYIKRAHNIIDTLLLTNLVLINFLSFFNFHRNTYQREAEDIATTFPAIVQMILIYLPLIVLCLYLLLLSCKKFIRWCECKVPLTRIVMFFVPKRATKLRMLIQHISSLDVPNEESVLHERVLDEDIDFMQSYYRVGDLEMIPADADTGSTTNAYYTATY